LLQYDSGSEFYELSYWILFVAKVLQYDSGSEFYELSYWILFVAKVLQYDSGSEFYELSYWILFVAKVLQYDSGSEFYELSYWILFVAKVLQYDSGSEFYELSYWILVFVAKFSNILQDIYHKVQHLMSTLMNSFYCELCLIKNRTPNCSNLVCFSVSSISKMVQYNWTRVG
jgi:hypothetical protein